MGGEDSEAPTRNPLEVLLPDCNLISGGQSSEGQKDTRS